MQTLLFGLIFFVFECSFSIEFGAVFIGWFISFGEVRRAIFSDAAQILQFSGVFGWSGKWYMVLCGFLLVFCLWALEGNCPIRFAEGFECFIVLTSLFNFTVSFFFAFLDKKEISFYFFIYRSGIFVPKILKSSISPWLWKSNWFLFLFTLFFSIVLPHKRFKWMTFCKLRD